MTAAWTFNLADEPWVPGVLPDGTTQYLGLRDILVRAHELREVRDASPLVTGGLYRLLFALTYRLWGERVQDHNDWRALAAPGRFAAQDIDAYFSTWRPRFDLFAGDYPFYQIWKGQDLGNIPDRSSPVTVLAAELAAGNNATLFDHTFDAQPPALGPAEAARLLVANQQYALAGLGGPGFPQRKDGPAARGVTLIPTGASLYETFLLNLVPVRLLEGFRDTGLGTPLWEREPGWERGVTEPAGLLDYLTWPARWVLLRPEADARGNPVVREARYVQGMALPDDFVGRFFDPWVSYRDNRDAKGRATPYSVLRFTPERAVWRDSTAILAATPFDDQPAGDGPRKPAPPVLRWLGTLSLRGAVDRSARYRLQAVGQATDQAKVTLWRHEQMPLRPTYLDQPDLLNTLGKYLALAEEVQRIARYCAEDIAQELLAGAASADKNAVAGLVKSWGVERTYWAGLDASFERLLDALPDDTDADHPAEDAWHEAVERAAWGAFRLAREAAPPNPRGFKAAVEAEGKFRAMLNARLRRSKEAMTV